jgi:uncharacterized membrane protein YfcA
MVQSLAACISGVIIHKHYKSVSGNLSVWMGTTIFIFALIGGAGSGYVSHRFLLLIFGILALLAVILMLMPSVNEDKLVSIANLSFSRWRAVLASGGVGFLGGMVGQGGSFILIPLMTYFMKIPTRVAIGSNLAIVLLSSTAGFLGKAVTGQIYWPLVLPIVLAVLPAVQLGGILSHRVAIIKLRKILGLVIAVAAVRILYTVFWG